MIHLGKPQSSSLTETMIPQYDSCNNAVPLLHDENIQQDINNKVLEANQKRTEAYKLEQEALAVINEKVIYTQ